MKKSNLIWIFVSTLMVFGMLVFKSMGTMIWGDSAAAASASAQQKPSVSIGSYVISANYQECFTRAQRALESEGYTAGRASEQFYWGAKGMHQAMIVCEPPGGSRYSYHVILASGALDARVTDAERDKLVARMAQANAGGGGPSTGFIEVLSGTYGANCGQGEGNRTNHLAAACNGKGKCDYKVDVTVLGDPAGGCAKNYIAKWRCGRDPKVRTFEVAPEAGHLRIAALSCQP